MGEAALVDDPLDVGGRTGAPRSSRSSSMSPFKIVDEVGIGVDRDQLRVGRQLFEDRAGEGADSRAIFDEQLGRSSQSTGSSILSIRMRLDGITDPTITGFLRKPRRNCQCGLLRHGRSRGARSGAGLSTCWRTRWRSRRCSEEDVKSGPWRWQIGRRLARHDGRAFRARVRRASSAAQHAAGVPIPRRGSPERR